MSNTLAHHSNYWSVVSCGPGWGPSFQISRTAESYSFCPLMQKPKMVITSCMVETIIPSPKGKPPQCGQTYLDLRQLNTCLMFILTPYHRIGTGNELGYCQHCYHQTSTHPLPGLYPASTFPPLLSSTVDIRFIFKIMEGHLMVLGLATILHLQ